MHCTNDEVLEVISNPNVRKFPQLSPEKALPLIIILLIQFSATAH